MENKKIKTRRCTLNIDFTRYERNGLGDLDYKKEPSEIFVFCIRKNIFTRHLLRESNEEK